MLNKETGEYKFPAVLFLYENFQITPKVTFSQLCKAFYLKFLNTSVLGFRKVGKNLLLHKGFPNPKKFTLLSISTLL